ncbi:MAG: hypothetical protein NT096_08870 [Proteobacteria bacterium]|nr:hypothetical protein [Pseudomonadota bacterium]
MKGIVNNMWLKITIPLVCFAFVISSADSLFAYCDVDGINYSLSMFYDNSEYTVCDHDYDCGGLAHYHITGVTTAKAPNDKCSGLVITESVWRDNGCSKCKGIFVTGLYCPIGTGNKCDCYDDYWLCCPPLSIPYAGCTEHFYQTLKVDGKAVENVTITWQFLGNYTCLYTFNRAPSVIPTVIELSSFVATDYNGYVLLEWETETEIDNEEFNLYRAESEDEVYVKINPSAIPAQGTTTSGATYQYVDRDVKNRTTYYYELEDVDIYGNRTIHGPVSATPRRLGRD